MPKEITIKLTFDKTWDSYAEENIADDFYVIDAIRNLSPGVLWQIQNEESEITERLHKALKGLGLEKHSIALNVLKIAGIELPKNEK